MAPKVRTKQRIEYGDFQTPLPLAQQICHVVAREFPTPASIIEPTCGRGSFLVAAAEEFPSVQRFFGLEIDAAYVDAARQALARCDAPAIKEIRYGSFFESDWRAILNDLPEPLLVVGNPPWVTNSAVSVLNGSNLPKKHNLHQLRGLEALTGKSNFDISEWMLIELLKSLEGKQAAMAMLCKTAVARKVLTFGWKQQLLSHASMRLIDASKHFGAAVDAALLFCSLGQKDGNREAAVYSSMEGSRVAGRIGYVDERLVADLPAFEATRHLGGPILRRWRSGIKHDCARVMEFHRVGERFQNGLGEIVDLEPDYLYPMLKSSDLASEQDRLPRRWMLVTQTRIDEDTRSIEHRAPKTWDYLQRHRTRLDRRGSSIYRNRPPYSIFGVGDYAFVPHKIAISGLYKHIRFTHVGPFEGKPVVFDDTCALLPCKDLHEAQFILELLGSEHAQNFYRARIFWDAKRPVKTEVLNELSLPSLAQELAPANSVTAEWDRRDSHERRPQLSLF